MLTAGAHLSNLPDFSSGGFSSSPYGVRYAPVAGPPAGAMSTVPAWVSNGYAPAGQATGGTTSAANTAANSGTTTVTATPVVTPAPSQPTPTSAATTPVPAPNASPTATLATQLATAQAQIQQMQPLYAKATAPANVVAPIWMLVAGGAAIATVTYFVAKPRHAARLNPVTYVRRWSRSASYRRRAK